MTYQMVGYMQRKVNEKQNERKTRNFDDMTEKFLVVKHDFDGFCFFYVF